MELYWYGFKLKRVIDGDTIVGDIDLGFNMFINDQHIRVAKVNTPEVRGKEKEEGLKVKSSVEGVLEAATEIRIHTTERDSFGRVIADVYVRHHTESWMSIADFLIANNLGEVVW